MVTTSRPDRPLPTVEIVGKAGRIRVNECDFEEWKKKGYKLASEVNSPSTPPPQDPLKTELQKMTVEQLKGIASDYELDDVPTKKDDIISALIEAGYEG